MRTLIEFRDVNKQYKMGEITINAVKNINFTIDEGEVVIILGESGAGKTTILNLLGGMDTATSGSIFVEGNDITKYNDRQLTDYRRYKVGFVFQFYNLIANLTALENVEFAANIKTDTLSAKEVLESIGLSERLKNFPSQLSGGEQQRVAIARALAKNPLLLLCDEPTGALDYNIGKQVLEYLFAVSKQYNKTLIIITHNSALAETGDKIIRLKSGEVLEIVKNDNKKDITQIEW